MHSNLSIGHLPNTAATRAFLKDCQTLLRGTNTRLIVRARNPNRQQFKWLQTKGGFRRGSISVRQSIPLSLASYFHLYLRRDSDPTTGNFKSVIGLTVIDTVRKIYAWHGQKIVIRA